MWPDPRSHAVHGEETYALYSRKGDVPSIREKMATSAGSEDSWELEIQDFRHLHPHYLTSFFVSRT